MDDRAAERRAANEATFRDANERIQARARDLEFDDRVPFLCECGDPSCREILRLTLSDYEEVRRDGRRFFVQPGHDDVDGEDGRVRSRGDGFVVIEKIGTAGDVAAERDPREPSQRG